MTQATNALSDSAPTELEDVVITEQQEVFVLQVLDEQSACPPFATDGEWLGKIADASMKSDGQRILMVDIGSDVKLTDWGSTVSQDFLTTHRPRLGDKIAFNARFPTGLDTCAQMIGSKNYIVNMQAIRTIDR